MQEKIKNKNKRNKNLQDAIVKLVPAGRETPGEIFENLSLFRELIDDYIIAWDRFRDDLMVPIENYEEWFSEQLKMVDNVLPWFFVGLANDEPFGFIWAFNWTGKPDNLFEVEVNAFAKRGTPIQWSGNALFQMLKMVFEVPNIYVVRFRTEADNKACLFSLRRFGITNFARIEAMKLKDGQEIAGIIGSITKTEFEDLKHGRI